MTEAEWPDGGTDPARMLDVLESSARDRARRLRLYGCACVRRVWGGVADEGARAAVAVAERVADGLATLKELRAAWRAHPWGPAA
jgi:hypothetical protein